MYVMLPVAVLPRLALHLGPLRDIKDYEQEVRTQKMRIPAYISTSHLLGIVSFTPCGDWSWTRTYTAIMMSKKT